MSGAETTRGDAPRQVRVGLVQLRCGPSPAVNLARTARAVEQAAEEGAHVVCLQELFRSQYLCQSQDVSRFDLAEPIPGPSTEALAKVAAEREVVVVAPVFERRAGGLYHNSAVVIDTDGSLVGTYRKMHIPDDPLYYEKFYFTPGDLGFMAHDTRFGRIGVGICWDQWFPETARMLALAGAEILFFPTAIGWQFDEGDETDASQHDAWETVQRGHAVANGTFVVAVNRVGHEHPSGRDADSIADTGARREGIRFWGQSFVADPFGRVLHRASADDEEVAVVSCDLDEVERTRRHWPFLRDRRVDGYADLARRWRD